MNILPALEDFAPTLRAWRHDLHAHPELAFGEHRTAETVERLLRSFGLETHRVAGTGVVGVLDGARPGPGRLGLRADLDALPMDEHTGLPYRSTHKGAFHGCGHDGHTTMLLGAARHLAAEPDFAGRVHFVFQPAEEAIGGGRVMVEEGLFERFPCDAVYALHNWPGLPRGHVAVRPGPIMASADQFDVIIEARGGHAAMPHRCTDPVVAAAHIVTALQTLVSRATDPAEAAVVSVTKVEAGSAYNVIPGSARLAGTVRSLTPARRDALEAGLRRVVAGVAAALGVEARVDFQRGYPPTINHAEPVETVARVAEAVVGADRVHRDLPPSMGGEDFAYMLQACPGAYFWLGGEGPTGCGLHHPGYDFDDALLPLGATLWVQLVRAALGGDQPGSATTFTS